MLDTAACRIREARSYRRRKVGRRVLRVECDEAALIAAGRLAEADAISVSALEEAAAIMVADFVERWNGGNCK